jgi:hypothetical protein
MGSGVPVPEYITIQGVVYYKGIDVKGYPAWYNDELKRKIIYYLPEASETLPPQWQLLEKQNGIYQVILPRGWQDSTQWSFYDATYTPFTGIEISGAFPSRINGTYARDDYQNVFEKRVTSWCKVTNQWNPNTKITVGPESYRPYRVDLIGLKTSLSKKYIWRISGAEMPYEFAQAFKREYSVPFGFEPPSIFFPPQSLWEPEPGSNASGDITITYRYGP